MRRRAAKGIGIFLVVMYVFTFISWKLDSMRTPWVLCETPRAGNINGIHYDRIVPAEAVYETDTNTYVYIVETNSGSWFYPVVARRVQVLIQVEDGANTAVQGIYSDAKVVRFADRVLSGSVSPVRLWEEDSA